MKKYLLTEKASVFDVMDWEIKNDNFSETRLEFDTLEDINEYVNKRVKEEIENIDISKYTIDFYNSALTENEYALNIESQEYHPEKIFAHECLFITFKWTEI